MNKTLLFFAVLISTLLFNVKSLCADIPSNEIRHITERMASPSKREALRLKPKSNTSGNSMKIMVLENNVTIKGETDFAFRPFN